MDSENDVSMSLFQIAAPRRCKQCGARLSRYNPADKCRSHRTASFQESDVERPLTEAPKKNKQTKPAPSAILVGSKEEPIEAVAERLRRRGLVIDSKEEPIEAVIERLQRRGLITGD